MSARLKQGCDIVSVFGCERDARRGCDRERDPVDVHRLGDRREQVTHDAQGLFGPDDVRHDERELVAPESGNSRPAAARADEALGDLAQQPVAGVVAKGVVDLLETVEVEQGDAALPVSVRALAARSRNRVRLGSPVNRS